MTGTLGVIIKTVIHSILFAVIWSVAAKMLGILEQTAITIEFGEQYVWDGLALLIVSLLISIVLSIFIKMGTGNKVIAFLVVFFMLLGVPTVITFGDMFFIDGINLPQTDLGSIFSFFLVVSFLYSLLLVIGIDRTRNNTLFIPKHKVQFSRKFWVWCASLLKLIIFYFGMNVLLIYLFALNYEQMRLLYFQNDVIMPFVQYLNMILSNENSILTKEIFQAISWIVFIAIQAKTILGRRGEVALVIGGTCCVLAASPLLLGISYIPQDAQFMYFSLRAISSFIFGVVVVYELDNSSVKKTISSSLNHLSF